MLHLQLLQVFLETSNLQAAQVAHVPAYGRFRGATQSMNVCVPEGELHADLQSAPQFRRSGNLWQSCIGAVMVEYRLAEYVWAEWHPSRKLHLLDV